MTENNMRPESLDWGSLGFDYIKTDYRFVAHYKDGRWDDGELIQDNTLHISEGSTALHYGQNTFEGLKAFRQENGEINLFRPQENAKRMKASAERLLMEPYPVEEFVEAVRKTVEANTDWVPPYGTGASLYIRPLLIGVGDNIGVKAAEEYLFTIFVMPVGPYYQKGLAPTEFITTDIDRAAPNGTGFAKVGGNYGGSLKASRQAQEAGYGDAIYLNPRDHKTIEEIGSSNFFAIKGDTFITPDSPSILPGITRSSLMTIAEDVLDMQIAHRPVPVEELEEFDEAGSCGTAAVVTPISAIQTDEKRYTFYDDEKVGPVTQKLYDTLIGIQYGEIEPPKEDWIVKV